MASQAVSVDVVDSSKSTRIRTIRAINDAIIDYKFEYETPKSLDSVLVSLGYVPEREVPTRKGLWKVMARDDYPLFSSGTEQARFASVVAYYTDAKGKLGYVFMSNPEADTPSLDEIVSNAQQLSSGLIERRLRAGTVTKISTAIGAIAGGVFGGIVAPATFKTPAAIAPTWFKWGFGLLSTAAGAAAIGWLGSVGNFFLLSDSKLNQLRVFNIFPDYWPSSREVVISGKAFSEMSHPDSFFYGRQAIYEISNAKN
ncbi:hypothetical protein HYY73_00675 [Candidatus Woesearchaeota archaeon]|nr:hypothetical protein [Candidatus Woesearchaeota archaeon]